MLLVLSRRHDRQITEVPAQSIFNIKDRSHFIHPPLVQCTVDEVLDWTRVLYQAYNLDIETTFFFGDGRNSTLGDPTFYSFLPCDLIHYLSFCSWEDGRITIAIPYTNDLARTDFEYRTVFDYERTQVEAALKDIRDFFSVEDDERQLYLIDFCFMHPKIPFHKIASFFAYLDVIEDTSGFDVSASHVFFHNSSSSEVIVTGMMGGKLKLKTSDNEDEEALRRQCSQLRQYSFDQSRVFGSAPKRYRKAKKNTKDKYIENPGAPVYGVELEVSTDKDTTELANLQERPFFICKMDSSISGSCDNMFEFVTRPMDIREHKVSWGKFFSAIYDEDSRSYPGFDITNKTNNGMHVHVGLDCFHSESHKKKFGWLFADPCSYEFLVYMSERGGKLNEYCRPLKFASRYTRKQCFDQVTANNYLGDRPLINFWTRSGKTVEVRLFKGLLSYGSVIKNLEFVDAAFWYSASMPYSKITPPNFMNWVLKQPANKYKNLKRFFETVPTGLYQRYDISQKLFSVNDYMKLPRFVEQNNIEVNQDLLIAANEKFNQSGKRLFKIKNGKLCIDDRMFSAFVEQEGDINPFIIKKAA